jgi:hypothetical protein
MFHLHVAKVDLDIVYACNGYNVSSVSYVQCKRFISMLHVTMAIHVCFKFMFKMFHLFYMYVANVSSRCVAKVDLDVAYVCNGYNVSSVSYLRCKCFIWMLEKYIWMLHMRAMAIHVCCKCMFQMFHLFQTY